MEEIIDRFDEVAEDYESFTEKIPQYRIMMEVINEVLSYFGSSNPPDRICELGIGTGEFASELIEGFEPQYFLGIDGSSNMITEAGDRLRSLDVETEIDLQEEEFSNWSPHERFDWIYSSLAIHHLQDDAKQDLFRVVRESLNDDGLFVLCDLVQRPESFIDMYKHVRKQRMLDAGFTEEDFRKRWEMHVRNDVPAQLNDLLGWLRKVGFSKVDCVWKDWNRCIVVSKL